MFNFVSINQSWNLFVLIDNFPRLYFMFNWCQKGGESSRARVRVIASFSTLSSNLVLFNLDCDSRYNNGKFDFYVWGAKATYFMKQWIFFQFLGYYHSGSGSSNDGNATLRIIIVVFLVLFCVLLIAIYIHWIRFFTICRPRITCLTNQLRFSKIRLLRLLL